MVLYPIFLDSLLRFPILVILVLLLISHCVYRFVCQSRPPVIASGSIIMALGVFVLYVLPAFTMSHAAIWFVSMEVFIIWVYLAFNLAQAYLHGELSLHLPKSLGIGTWVAGTVLMALLFDQVEHTLHGFIVLFAMAAFVLWLFYLGPLLQWIIHGIVRGNIKRQRYFAVNGKILLGAISTQAIVLLLYEFFHANVPTIIYQILIILGLCFYFVGCYALMNYWLNVRHRYWITVWPSNNCMIYSAMALVTLVLLETQLFPRWLTHIAWWWTIISFVFVAALEMARAYVRLQKKGISGIWVYHTSQWVRIFAFGMVYGMTVFYHNQRYADNDLVMAIINYGHYIVAIFLVLEIILAFTRPSGERHVNTK
jgi:hypothetical protein